MKPEHAWSFLEQIVDCADGRVDKLTLALAVALARGADENGVYEDARENLCGSARISIGAMFRHRQILRDLSFLAYQDRGNKATVYLLRWKGAPDYQLSWNAPRRVQEDRHADHRMIGAGENASRRVQEDRHADHRMIGAGENASRRVQEDRHADHRMIGAGENASRRSRDDRHTDHGMIGTRFSQAARRDASTGDRYENARIYQLPVNSVDESLPPPLSSIGEKRGKVNEEYDPEFLAWCREFGAVPF